MVRPSVRSTVLNQCGHTVTRSNGCYHLYNAQACSVEFGSHPGARLFALPPFTTNGVTRWWVLVADGQTHRPTRCEWCMDFFFGLLAMDTISRIPQLTPDRASVRLGCSDTVTKTHDDLDC